MTGRVLAADVARLEDGSHAPLYELPLRHQGKERTLLQLVDAPRADLRFGIDGQGEIYVLTKQDGMIRRMAAFAPAESSLWPVEHPDDLFEPELWTSLTRKLQATVQQLRGKR